MEIRNHQVISTSVNLVCRPDNSGKFTEMRIWTSWIFTPANPILNINGGKFTDMRIWSLWIFTPACQSNT